jgi:SAM-dependent methyltransferase
VQHGQLPDQLPFENLSFELVVMTDVLEHLVRDEESLTVIRERLKPGGTILATVPAFPFLWSAHDDTPPPSTSLHGRRAARTFRARRIRGGLPQLL